MSIQTDTTITLADIESSAADPYEAERRAAVDAVIGASGSRATASVARGEGYASWNSFTQESEAEAATTSDRLADNGVHIPAARAALQKRIDDAHAALQAGKHREDGTLEFDLMPGTEARAVAERRFQQIVESALYEEQILNRLEEQRANDAQNSASVRQEELLKAAYVQGDPRRAALLEEELGRAEARSVAQSLLKLRIS